MATKIEFTPDTVNMSFYRSPEGIYHIQPHDRYGQMTGCYDLSAADLQARFPASLADYIKTECELSPDGYHSVSLQQTFAIPDERLQAQRKRLLENSQIEKETLNPDSNTKISLENVGFISFGKDKGDIYHITTNRWAGGGPVMLGDYYVAEKDLATVLSPTLSDYIQQASQLEKPIGAYDAYGLETEAWKYGWHSVPVQQEYTIPQEYSQELNSIVGRSNMIVPTRINDVELTPEQQNALRWGELVVVKNISHGDEKKTLAVLLDKNHGFQKMEIPFFMANAPLSEIKELWNENARFNEQLNQQAEGKLEQGHVYDLGYPKAVLLSTGIPELPIHLSAKTLNIKSHDKLHGYELREIRGLASSLQQPWAIFKYGDADKAQNMIVGLSFEEKHFLVGMSLRPTVNGQVLEINSVRNVFPKDNHEWINWITQGKLLRVDEPKKIQDIIDKLRINPVAFGYVDLDSATKILKEFKNPKLPVKIPSKINGIALSAKQKEVLRSGNRIKVPAAGNPGKTVSVKLNEDGRPVIVPPAKPAIKQKPEQHRSIR